MEMQSAIKLLNEWEFKRSAYNLLMSTAYFDDSTIAPKDGLAYRSQRMAYIAGIQYEIETDSQIKALLADLANQDLDPVNKRKVYLYQKGIKETEAIPKNEYTAFTLAVMASQNAWEKAKKANDYAIFEPHLKKMIEFKRRFAHYQNPDGNCYDTLLDNFEPGMSQASYDPFFTKIKEELLPIIKKIAERQELVDDHFIYQFYPSAKQAELMTDINHYLGFDPSWGYMGVSPHPFTSGLSNDDVRVTTAYDEGNISSSIYSIIHEVGHAFYEHQVDKDYDGTCLKNISSGMHESQSRLFENYLGRNTAFIANYFPKLKSLFPEQMAKVDLHSFSRAVNAAKPSLIRTDADELTYPIHILIRYELEKGIFSGQIDLEDLDKTWDGCYERYLGIRANKVSQGILQDIHWSDGSFGYFPTYALGSAVGAQIMHKMGQDIDIEKALKEDFSMITAYLKEHIQRYGALYDLNDILLKATGESFDPDYYIDYLKEKYSRIYKL